MKIHLFSSIVFLVPFIFVLFSVWSFGIGYHNVDLCYNGELLNEKYDLGLVDLFNTRDSWNFTDCYIYGLNQITFSFFLFGISMLFLGVIWRHNFLR